MSNRFTYKGRIHSVGPVHTFPTGFRKRDVVCVTDSGKYNNYAFFTVKNDNCDKVGALKPGDEVAVDFVLDAREWDGPKGKRWFGGANALKVELASGASAGSPDAEKTVGEATDDEDLPF